MTTLRIAEWFLARLSSNQRASEMIGDLLEQHPTQSLKLWLAILRLNLALSWRWLVGIPLAALSMIVTLQPWIHFARTLGIHSTHIWKVSMLLSLVSISLWSMATLALVRFGPKNPLTRIALGISVLSSFASMAFISPIISYASISAMALLIFMCLFKKPTRLPMLNFLAASISVTGVFTLLSLACFRVFHLFRFAHGKAPTPTSTHLFMCVLLFSVLTGAWVLARLNRNTAIPTNIELA